MSLLERIEELQKKPESYRRKVLMAIMITMAPIVLSIWFFTLNLSSVKNDEEKIEIQTPLALVIDSFTEVYGVFKDKLLGLKSINN